MRINTSDVLKRYLPILMVSVLVSCGEVPEGLAPATPANTTVVMDFEHRPLPDIPLPNNVATRYDPLSATGRRINASMVAPTRFEARTRELLDGLDGWGVFMPITIPFSGPLDVLSIREAHSEADYATANDVIYLVNIDPDSAELGKIQHLDVGKGNYPMLLEELHNYQPNDPRGWTLSLLFEEADEDINGNGVLDPGEDTNRNGSLDSGEDTNGNGILDPPEDTDADGVLDRPNYLPGMNPERDDLQGRADALMTFFELETNTLIVRPMVPLRERTTYAVIVTRRMLDADGEPVGSPYPGINHNAQTEELRELPAILEQHSDEFGGLKLDEIGFVFSFTTQSVESQMMAVRDGIYGYGAQAHLGAEYPAQLDAIDELVDTDAYPDINNPHILHTEFLAPIIAQLAPALTDDTGDSDTQAQLLTDSHNYIDYHVIGSFTSPQLYDRVDEDEVPLDYNDQSWPPDLDRVPASARPETVYFWLVLPRPEISLRGQGQPAPLIMYNHGYTSNHLDAIAFAGFFAQHGVATLAIDNVSHGMSMSESEANTYGGLADMFNLKPFFEAVIQGRAIDHDNDGKPDSGADFFTAYAFHTRDNVRQGTLDNMQLMRILRTFDGQQRWDFDLDGDGENELAGDFDGDGVLDIGGDSTICTLGISLGSFMSTVLGSVEPNLDCVAAILPGGGVTDISVRSLQGGVPEAFALRVMGPLYIGNISADTGLLQLSTILPSGNDDERRELAQVEGILPGDTLVARNLDNDETGCGYVTGEGTVRLGLPSDMGNSHRLEFYRGPSLVTGSTECELVEGAELVVVVDTFGHGYPAPVGEDDEEGFVVEFESQLFLHGDPLVALGDGLGLHRASPEFRRLVSLSQAVLDPADPAVYSSHLLDSPLIYESTGERTETHMLALAMVGDMSVPTSTAAALGRAMGLLDYLEVDPRYGVPPNEVLLDTYSIEGVHLFNRHQYGEEGQYTAGVHQDLENFSGGTDYWGDNLPRLDPPLRLFGDDGHGGVSAFFYALPRPEGEHGFPLPGELEGRVQEECRDACPEGDDCGCSDLTTFDPALFYFNLVGHYLASGGTLIDLDQCMASNDCRCPGDGVDMNCLGWPESPPERPLSEFNR